MTKHALLSASSASRWLNCPPSARLTENIKEETSVYAEEGSLAHELAELKVRKHFIEPMGPRKFNNRVNKLKEHILWQDEMQGHTDVYLEYIQGIAHSFSFKPYITAEKKVDYSAWVPEGFGTADCIVIGGTHMYIVDFKYGKGVPVSAVENPQMKLYALGAYQAYRMLYDIQEIHMTIVQPRLDNTSEYSLRIDDLLAWAEQIKPIAQNAFDGKGEFLAGEHCKFCKAKATCRERAEKNLELAGFTEIKPKELTNEEIGHCLLKGRDIAKWVKDLEEYALKECLEGKEIPGWKAVEGRTTRVFKDQDKAFEMLKASGIDEAILYERRALTLAQVEKVIGKKEFKELVGDQVIKSPGKPTLAVESDKRQAITNQVNAEDVFKAVEGGIDDDDIPF